MAFASFALVAEYATRARFADAAARLYAASRFASTARALRTFALAVRSLDAARFFAVSALSAALRSERLCVASARLSAFFAFDFALV